MDFIKNNWTQILTALVGLYGAVLSTYLALKNRVIIKLSFEFGILPMENKMMIPYGSIYIRNLSNKKIYIKNYGFISGDKLTADTKTLPSELTNNLKKSMVHKKQIWPPIITNEKIKLVDSNKVLDHYEGVYAFYDLDNIKKFVSKNNIKRLYCFVSTHEKVYTKKIKLNELMSLGTRNKIDII